MLRPNLSAAASIPTADQLRVHKNGITQALCLCAGNPIRF